MSKQKKKKNERAPSSQPAGEDSSAGAQRAYEQFLPAARALDARDVLMFRADAMLAQHNVSVGVEALTSEKARITKELPTLDYSELEMLNALSMAVVFASAQVDRKDAPKTGLRALQARAYQLRALLLAAAESLVLAGLVPARSVAKIREGRGPIDVAKDCVALAALFRKHPDASKKTVVTAAQVKEAAEIGTALLAALKPSSAKKSRAAAAEVREAADVRDRMWTLLVTRHEDAWRAGAWLFGRAADERVPPLQARNAAKKKTPNPASPTREPGA